MTMNSTDDCRISVVINTYNAASQLGRALQSARGFDEIVVCDMESTDDTVALAESYGAKVVTFPKGDYNICEPARDFAIHSASCPWVLVIDADEAVPDTLREWLYGYIRRPDAADALSVPFASMFMGRFTSTRAERHVRFFRRDKAYWPPIIHSHVQIDGRTDKIPARRPLEIEHFDDPTLARRIDKLNRYSDNEVPKRLNRRYSTMSLLVRPWLFFFKMLILKGSIRDGRRGIIRAYMEMAYQIALLGKHFEQTSANDTKQSKQ
ncbi:MAG: glycosyltransferase family 2 protein [Muribaculaceae bacterium]|nr:glycosyltransferase family 2 protein [Muribaculaceae bacterium]